MTGPPPDDDYLGTEYTGREPNEPEGNGVAGFVAGYVRPYAEHQNGIFSGPPPASPPASPPVNFGSAVPEGSPPEPVKPSLVQRLRDRLVRVEPSWITETPAPLDYLVRDTRTGRGALEARGIGLLVAAGSAGKGFMSLSLGVAVSTGEPWLGCMSVEKKGRVLFVSAEDAARTHLRRRLYYVAKAMGVRELGDNIDILDIRDVHVPMLTPDGIPGEGAEALCELVREGGPYALIVVDPISKVAGASIDADNVNANALIGALEALSVAADGFVLGGHHSALRARLSQDTGATSSRGATGLTDSARAVMTLSVERLEHGDATLDAHLGDLVTVHLVKANHVRVWEPVVLRRCENGELAPLDAPDQGLVDQARERGSPQAAKKAELGTREASEDEAVLQAVRAQPAIPTQQLIETVQALTRCGEGRAKVAIARVRERLDVREGPRHGPHPTRLHYLKGSAP